VKRSHYEIELTVNLCIALSSSRKTVSFIGAQNETFSVAAMCVSNPDCAPPTNPAGLKNFTVCSRPFAARPCSVRVVRSLSVAPQ
jgi:hypothetical protein